MSLLSRASELFQQQPQNRESVIAKIAPTGNKNRPLPQPHDFRTFADEGYRRNVIIYACIKLIARTASEPDLVVARPSKDGGREPVEDSHPLAQLLAHPNPEQSQYEWLETLLTEFQYAGIEYTHKVRPRAGNKAPPVELWQLRPDKTRIVPDAQGFLSGYVFGETPDIIRAPIIPAEDVIRLKMPDPLNDYYGLSPIGVLSRSGDLDNQAVDYLRSMFTNMGEPSAVLIFKEKMNREDHERVRQLWRDSHGGKDGWHSIASLDSTVEYKQVGSRPNEMNLQGIFSHTETRMCAAFGVPPILIAAWIGLLRSTYANYNTALKDLWIDTLTPMYTRIGDKLTVELAREFGDDLEIFFDLSRVAALQEDQESRRTFALSAWKDELWTRNQALDFAGLPPIEGPEGDERKMPAGGGGGLFSKQNGGSQFVPGFQMVEPLQLEQGHNGETLAIPADEFPKQPAWKAIHRAADKIGPSVAGAFRAAVNESQKGVTLSRLESALSAKDKSKAELEVLAVWRKEGAEILKEELAKPFSDLFNRGVMAGNSELPEGEQATGPEEQLQVDVPSDAADEWARAQIAALVAEVDEGTRFAIRQAIDQMFEEGVSARVIATRIRDQLGLTKRWVQFLANEEARFLAGEPARRIGNLRGPLADRLAKLTRQLIRERALRIARNEGLRAASAGQSRVWDEALQQGLVPADQVQFWITVPDERTCPICAPMEGQEQPIGGDFITGIGTSVKAPPEPHPSCRCARGLR